ncbi:hypothetical protein F511_21201 [Dorcoceras hygrometricum]|uniref:Uncharacterized protein n=1 Tax=Dorcoceras hygrometricum TaxID=472368 RepID=A0A2Z7BUX9_9LAMI|nr:hypothetical protein F511_21201 [Dorcoceras hygrometricum]
MLALKSKRQRNGKTDLIAQTDLSTTPTTTRSLACAIQNTLNAEDSKTTTHHSKQILALNTTGLSLTLAGETHGTDFSKSFER